jgi:hypothetical protein
MSACVYVNVSRERDEISTHIAWGLNLWSISLETSLLNLAQYGRQVGRNIVEDPIRERRN